MTYYDQYASHHAYARRSGYTGSYDEYVKGLYKAYKDICKRCEVKPMSFDQWRLQACGDGCQGCPSCWSDSKDTEDSK